jgi:hypothetical protein
MPETTELAVVAPASAVTADRPDDAVWQNRMHYRVGRPLMRDTRIGWSDGDSSSITYRRYLGRTLGFYNPRERSNADIPLCCFDVATTPIFDLEQPPPEPPGTWLPRLIGGIIGLFVTFLFILEDQHKLPDWHWPAFNGLLIIPALYLVIAAHEAGHLVAARLAGIETGGIAIGGFIVAKSGKNWVFRFEKRLLYGFFKPLTGTEDLHPARYAWMVEGGPFASLCLIVLCGWLSARFASGAWQWIGTLFWTSLIGLISLIPISSALNKSDGMLLWMLLRHPDLSHSWMALLAIQSEDARGVRPREWNPQLFEQMLPVDIRASGYSYCHILAYYRCFEEGAIDAALMHLEKALAGSARTGKAFRHALFLEAASASAVIRMRAEQARIWCKRACKLRKPDSLEALEAGIAMCEGRYQEAARHLEAARKYVIERRLDSGLIRFAKEKWTEQEAICNERG